jgi:hypothetical protein
MYTTYTTGVAPPPTRRLRMLDGDLRLLLRQRDATCGDATCETCAVQEEVCVVWCACRVCTTTTIY